MKSSIEFYELKGSNIYEVKISLKVNKKNIIKKTIIFQLIVRNENII